MLSPFLAEASGGQHRPAAIIQIIGNWTKGFVWVACDPCRSELAREDLSFSAGYLGVPIHCCGNGCLWLTPAPCRSEHARDGLSFSAGYLGVHIHCCGNGRLWLTPAPCRSEPARDGLSFNVGYLGVHIRCCGNGRLWFRPYGESLFQTPVCRPSKKEPKGFAPPFGASPRLGMPSLRHCSVGPPRPAIHSLTRLSRHPCRDAHCATPAFGLWERGGWSKIKSNGNGNGNGNGNCNCNCNCNRNRNRCRSCRRLRSFDLKNQRQKIVRTRPEPSAAPTGSTHAAIRSSVSSPRFGC
jgi:hypothetical protein